MSIERRKHGRVEVHLQASLVQGGTTSECNVRDISIGGAFVVASVPLTYGDTVKIHVQLPGTDQVSALGGTVRWIHDDGCGVQWDAMGVRETHAIVELTKKG